MRRDVCVFCNYKDVDGVQACKKSQLPHCGACCNQLPDDEQATVTVIIDDVLPGEFLTINGGLKDMSEKSSKQLKSCVCGGSYLSVNNHLLGCRLEAMADVLRYRGLEKEAEALEHVASKIK